MRFSCFPSKLHTSKGEKSGVWTPGEICTGAICGGHGEKERTKAQLLPKVPVCIAAHSTRAMLLKTKFAFPAAFFRGPFPAWTKKRWSTCALLSVSSTGGSVPLLTFMEKEQSPLRLFLSFPGLDRHFVISPHRMEPVLAIVLKEDEAF